MLVGNEGLISLERISGEFPGSCINLRKERPDGFEEFPADQKSFAALTLLSFTTKAFMQMENWLSAHFASASDLNLQG